MGFINEVLEQEHRRTQLTNRISTLVQKIGPLTGSRAFVAALLPEGVIEIAADMDCVRGSYILTPEKNLLGTYFGSTFSGESITEPTDVTRDWDISICKFLRALVWDEVPEFRRIWKKPPSTKDWFVSCGPE